MNRFLTLAIIALSISNISHAQTYLKANAAYWALGITNISAETKIAQKWTINSDLVYSPWKRIDGNHFEFFQIIPEARFYPKNAYNGLYVGGYASFQMFNMTKWNYWNKNMHQRGRGFALGASVGYVFEMHPQWNMDVYMGAGWQNSQYRGYHTKTGEQYVPWNGSGEWLPYKIGIAIAYKL